MRPKHELRESKLTLANCVSSAFAGCIPKFSHICPVSTGQELPAKIRVLRIAIEPTFVAFVEPGKV